MHSEPESGEEESEEGEPVVVLEGHGEALVIAGEAAESSEPAECSFDDPPLR